MVLRCIRAILCFTVLAVSVPAFAGDRPNFHHLPGSGQFFGHNPDHRFQNGRREAQEFRIVDGSGTRDRRYSGDRLRYIPQFGQLGRSSAVRGRTLVVNALSFGSANSNAGDTYVYGTSGGIVMLQNSAVTVPGDDRRPLAKVIEVEFGQNACSYEGGVCVIRP